MIQESTPSVEFFVGENKEFKAEYSLFVDEPDYRTWKKNSSYLYDVLITNELFWPVLTVDWLPDRTTSGNGDYFVHNLVYGTQDDEKQNSLIISRFQLPNFERAKRENLDQIGDGSYGVVGTKQEVFVRINHHGHVNRARHMPQNPFFIATKSSNSKVYIFDYSKHPSVPESVDDFKPNLILGGHVQDGFGLSWNRRLEGHLISGSNDSRVCYYDINEAKKDDVDKLASPVQVFKGHEGAVNDVCWHGFHTKLFISVGDDRQLFLWDTRTSKKPMISSLTGHTGSVLCVAPNPFNPYLIATGSSDKTAALFDCRNLKTKLHTFTGHTNEILQIGWSPQYETVLATSSSDKTMRFHDLLHIGKDSTPETMFVHAGHCDTITDFSFSLADPWLMASVAYDNSLHLWKMNGDAYRSTLEAKFEEV